MPSLPVFCFFCPNMNMGMAIFGHEYDHDFDNFGGKKVVIWTILTLNQAKSLSVVDRRF